MLAEVVPLSRLLHYVGFALAIGSAIAVTIARRRAAKESGPARPVLDVVIAEVVAKVEVPGLFIALLGGLLAIVANPGALDPSGAQGPWLYVKMPMVIALLVIAHVKMFDARSMIREREHGAKDDELVPIVARGAKLDLASIALSMLVLLVASFRFILFA